MSKRSRFRKRDRYRADHGMMPYELSRAFVDSFFWNKIISKRLMEKYAGKTYRKILIID